MPDTPSTMFDHTVSRSLPIGVTKPMPVTTTRRPLEPLELFVTTRSLPTPGRIQIGALWENKAHCLDTNSSLSAKAACEDPKQVASEDGWPGYPGRRRAAHAACPGGTAPYDGAASARPRGPSPSLGPRIPGAFRAAVRGCESWPRAGVR